MAKKHQDFLEIKTLGEFLVKRGPVVLSEMAGRSTKLWELFKYLLTYRGNRLVSDSVLEILWPDQDYENAGAAFKVQIYRLKQLLGDKPEPGDLTITYSQGCYRLDTGARCQIDTDAVEKHFSRAIDLAPNNPDQAMEAYRTIIQLYKGDYLPEITGAWVLPTRNHYQRIFLKSVLELSNLYCQSQRHQDAIRICEQALQAAPLKEELHIKYLQVLTRAGKMREAQAHYEYITSFYYLELGVKPSDELKEVYSRINPDRQKIELDLGSIREVMEGREKTDGAFYCCPEHFNLLYKLEKRRLKREDRPVFMGLLTIMHSDGSVPPANILADASVALKRVISSAIRAGDVYTQWNKAQFLLLLPGLQREQGEQVLQRIGMRFQKEPGLPGLILRYKIQPLLQNPP